MNQVLGVVLVVAIVAVLVGSCSCLKERAGALVSKDFTSEYCQLTNINDIVASFPRSAQEIHARKEQAMAQARTHLEQVLAMPHEQRTFANTVRALDILQDHFGALTSPFQLLEMLSPQAELREAARAAVHELQEFSVDTFNTPELYAAFKGYAAGNAQKEELNEAERYFLNESLLDLERKGLGKPADELAQIKQLKKDIAARTLQFSANIAEDESRIVVSKDALAGLDEAFVEHLKRDEAGNYIVTCDYPTYFEVMAHCSVPTTRRDLYRAFNNRAYEKNLPLLHEIIALRDRLARALDFASYAHCNLVDEMAQTPERAHEFIVDLLGRLQGKARQEFSAFVAELPEGVVLNEDGTLNPWDLEYVKAHYKKKHYQIDERLVAEYFPLQKTIDGLFDIYQKFFDLRFEFAPIKDLWHSDTQLIRVYNNDDNRLMGNIILDLHPRPNKYSHACHAGFISALDYVDASGKRVQRPSSAVVVANFPKSTKDKPALLKHSDVVTFFHEFGHAMHNLLGATELVGTSGTNVKTDFVELPSQMLENWMWDKGMLRQLSSHYKEGTPLPETMIDNMIKLKQYDAGMFDQRQCALSLVSLLFYGPGADKDTNAIVKQIWTTSIPMIHFDDNNHFHASFGHLTGYGARYYGYQWSRVFAQDVFEQVEQEGLLNPVAGKRLSACILSKGGSVDPNQLLVNYLGREPRMDAFLADIGLEK